jgi:uncharacterized protein with HEPN domain
MTRRDPLTTLAQIAEHARQAQDLCAGKMPEELTADWKSSLALERVLEIIGEAVKRLPPDLCEEYPSVPWKLWAGMRDSLSHGYDNVDHEILWNTVQQDLPDLLKIVEQMLTDLRAEGQGA